MPRTMHYEVMEAWVPVSPLSRMGFRLRRWPVGTTLIHGLRLMTRAVHRSVQSAVVLSWTDGHPLRVAGSNCLH